MFGRYISVHGDIASYIQGVDDVMNIKSKLLKLGIKLEAESGHIYYLENYKPVQLDYDLVFIRHGETYGNCGQVTELGEIDVEMVKSGKKDKEKRIFQGDVDDLVNQLTEVGMLQAENVAAKMFNDFLLNDWNPDVILISPLMRARQTAEPFVIRYELQDNCMIDDEIKEMSFGVWDNRRVCDFDQENPCHLFYRSQHALVKQSGVNFEGVYKNGENFADVLLRAYCVLMRLNDSYAGKKVLMFSHSMFGAACSILLGKGQQVENDNYLAFDGKRSDGSSYTMSNATPYLLSTRLFDAARLVRTKFAK